MADKPDLEQVKKGITVHFGGAPDIEEFSGGASPSGPLTMDDYALASAAMDEDDEELSDLYVREQSLIEMGDDRTALKNVQWDRVEEVQNDDGSIDTVGIDDHVHTAMDLDTREAEDIEDEELGQITGRIAEGTPQAKKRLAERGIETFEPEKKTPAFGRTVEAGRTMVKGIQDLTGSMETGAVKGALQWYSALGIIDPERADLYSRLLDAANQMRGIDKESLASGIGDAIGRISPAMVPLYTGFAAIPKVGPELAIILAESTAAAMGLDPNDENFASMIPEEKWGAFFDGVRDLMATDPDDPAWINRARNFAENFFLVGGAVGAARIGRWVNDLRLARKAQMDQEGGEPPETPPSTGTDLMVPERPPAQPVHPSQRSLTEGRMDASGNVIMPPVFYQKSIAALDQIKDESAKTERWVNLFKNQGISADEMEWSGINEILEFNKGKRITKEQMREYLEANRVEVIEVVAQDYVQPVVRYIRKGSPFHRRYGTSGSMGPGEGMYVVFIGDRPVAQTVSKEGAEAVAKRLRLQMPPNTKWGSWIAEGDATNYREFRVILPARGGITDEAFSRRHTNVKTEASVEYAALSDERRNLLAERREWEDQQVAAGNLGPLIHDMDQDIHRLTDIRNDWQDIADLGVTNIRQRRDRLLRRDDLSPHQRRIIEELNALDDLNTQHREAVFTGGHFPQNNVLFHMRTTDRVNDEGERILFVEEFQSDWFQKDKFKTRALKQKRDEAIAKHKKADEELQGIAKEVLAGKGKYNPEYYKERLHEELVNINRQYASANEALPPTGQWGEVRGARTAIEEAFILNRLITKKLDELRDLDHEATILRAEWAQGVPDAPFKDTWHQMALRRMIRFAADNDYDAVAWTDSEMQVARWNRQYEKLYQDIYDNRMPKYADKIGKKHGAKTFKTEGENIGVEGGEKQGWEVVDPHNGDTIDGPFDTADEAREWIYQNQDYSVDEEWIVYDNNGREMERFGSEGEADDFVGDNSYTVEEVEVAAYRVYDEDGDLVATYRTREEADEAAASDMFDLTVEDESETVWVTRDQSSSSDMNLDLDDPDDIERLRGWGQVYDNADDAYEFASDNSPYHSGEPQYALYVDGDHIDEFPNEDAARDHFYENFEWMPSETGVEGGGEASVWVLPLKEGLKNEAKDKGFPMFTVAGGIAGLAAEGLGVDEVYPDDERMQIAQHVSDEELAQLGPGIRRSFRRLFGGKAGEGATGKPHPQAQYKPLPGEDEILQVYDRYREGGLVNEKIDFNLRNLESSDEADAIINEVSKAYAARIDRQKHGVVPLQVTRDVADLLGVDPNLAEAAVATLPADVEGLHVRALVMRDMMVKSAEEVDRAAFRIHNNPAGVTDEQRLEFRKQLTRHVALQTKMKGVQTEIARALSAFRIPAGEADPFRVQMIEEALLAGGGRDKIDHLASLWMETPVDKRGKLAAKMLGAKTVKALREIWINGLLSGLRTHEVNFVSNMLFTWMQIPERAVGGLIGEAERAVRRARGLTPDPDQVRLRESAAMLYGFFEGVPDGLKLAWKTFKEENPASGLGKIEAQRYRSISAVEWGLDDNSLLGRSVDWFGRGIRLPGRFLMTADEFQKGIGRAMERRALAYRESQRILDEGGSIDDASQRYLEIEAGTDANIEKQIGEFADTVTFTKNLGEAGQTVQHMVHRVPGAWMVAPFIRTPVNVVKEFGKRTPLAALMPSVRADLAAGGARRQMAISRIAAGSSLMGWGVYLANNGIITGSGPEDPKQRAAWLQKNEPYAIDLKKLLGEEEFNRRGYKRQFVPYGRLEPLGILFGVASDLAQYRQWAPRDLADAAATDLITVAAGSVIKNLGSKTYLRGVADFAQAYDEPGRYLENYLARLGSSFMPYSSMVRDIKSATDPLLRDTSRKPYSDDLIGGLFERTLNEWKARTPGFSKDLPVKLSFWGEERRAFEGEWYEAFNAFNVKSKSPQPIDDELIRLRYPLSMPRRQGFNVKMSPVAYHKLVKAMNDQNVDPESGKVTTMRQALNDVVKSPAYQSMADLHKIGMLTKARNKFVDLARGRLMVPGDKYYDEEFAQWVQEAAQARGEGQTFEPVR